MFVNGISQLPSAMHMLVITVPPTILRGWRTRALQLLFCYKSPTNDAATVSGPGYVCLPPPERRNWSPSPNARADTWPIFHAGRSENSTRLLHDNRDCFVCPISLVLGTMSFS